MALGNLGRPNHPRGNDALLEHRIAQVAAQPQEVVQQLILFTDLHLLTLAASNLKEGTAKERVEMATDIMVEAYKAVKAGTVKKRVAMATEEGNG